MRISSRDIVKSIPTAVLQGRMFGHMGIGIINGALSHLARILPPAVMGKYSTRNREGWTVVRRDLPKITEMFYLDTPNFGDWSRGSHTIEYEREVYQRDYIDPLECELLIEIMHQDESEAVFKVVVDLPLDRSSNTFDEQLLFALNLLQENLGSADVLPTNAKAEQLLSTLGLSLANFSARYC